MSLVTSYPEYPVIQSSDPIDPRREISAMPGLSSKTVFLLTSNLAYPAIQISDPIDARREISAMPGCI